MSQGLPHGWSEAPLGELTSPTRPRHAPQLTPHLPFIGMEHVEAHTMRLLGTVRSGEMRSSAVHFQAGDVLYGRLRPYLNKVLRPNFEGLCSAEFIVFPDSEHLEAAYLQYFLNSSELVAFASQLNAGDRPRVDFEQIASFPVPVPPLAEQRRIVAAIEEHLSRLDAAVAGLKRVQLQLPRYRAAVLKAAVEENFGSEVKTVSLGSLLREPLRNGHSAKKSETGAGVRTLTLTAVTVGDFGERNTKLTVAEPDRVRDLWLEAGDILVERSNTGELVGTVRQYAGPHSFAIFPDLLIRVRIKSEHSPRFVEIALQALHSRGYFRERASGIAGSMPKIDQGDVAAAPIPLFPAEEQQHRVAEYDVAESIADSLKRTVERELANGAGMRQAILRRAFEGRLVAQDPNDEPASMLLERILTARTAAPIKPGRPRREGARC